MTYFADLTPYTYSGNTDDELGRSTLNIGWLCHQNSFPVGETSQEFIDKLFEYCLDKHIVELMRGFHACEFCNLSWEDWFDRNKYQYGQDAHWASIGDGEIRVIGRSAIYAAPALIYHYVTSHSYKPPDEFVEAVLFGPTAGTGDHEALIKKLTK